MAQAVGMLFGMFTSSSTGGCEVGSCAAESTSEDVIQAPSEATGGYGEERKTGSASDKDRATSEVLDEKHDEKEAHAKREEFLKGSRALVASRPGRSVFESAPEDGSVLAKQASPEAGSSTGSEDGSNGTTASSQRSTMSMLLGIFSSQPAEPATDELQGGPERRPPPPSPQLEELRQAVERAEAAGASSELVEHVRAKLEELEQELERDVQVNMLNAVSGEVVGQVRARPCDTASRLREGLMCQAMINTEDEGLSSINFLFGDQLLQDTVTLAEAGIRHGDSVTLVRRPLRCVTASFDGTVRLWELHTKESEGCPCRCFRQDAAGHGPVLSAAMEPGGKTLLTVASGGEGQLWCAETGEALAELEGPAATGLFSPEGCRVMGASSDDAVHIWCAKTGQCLRSLEGHAGEVRAARFSPDGKLALTGAGDGSAALWDIASGELLTMLEGHSDVVKSVDFSPDGTLAATASADGTARVWAVQSGKCIQVFQGHAKAISTVSFSPDGSRLLTASAFDGTARIWDAVTGVCNLVIPGDGNVVNDAIFSPDGQKVLLASASESLRLYDAETGECVVTMFGHEDWVRCASFSPDGMIIGSACYDGTARLWSAATGKCLRTLEGHSGAVISISVLEC